MQWVQGRKGNQSVAVNLAVAGEVLIQEVDADTVLIQVLGQAAVRVGRRELEAVIGPLGDTAGRRQRPELA